MNRNILPETMLATALMLVLNLGIAGAKVSGSLGKYATIKNFQRYSNKETSGSYLVKQTITVNADDKAGDEYVLATGDMTGYLTDNRG